MAEHTFVIPAYQNSPHLETCVKALMSQKVSSDVLIATATPSKYIETIASQYNIPYYISQQQGGIGCDWNFAVNKASTRYVTIAHQDDIYDESYTEEILKYIKKSEGSKPLIAFSGYTDIVGSKERRFSLNALIKSLLLFPFWFKSSIRSKVVKKGILALGNPICCPAVTIDKHNVKDFEFSETYTCILDWAAWLHLANEDGAFIYVPKKLVGHRIHTDSETTNQIRNGRRQQEELEILSSIWGSAVARFLSKWYIKGYRDNKV